MHIASSKVEYSTVHPVSNSVFPELCGHLADCHGHRWPGVGARNVCPQHRTLERHHQQHPTLYQRRSAAAERSQARLADVAKVLQGAEAGWCSPQQGQRSLNSTAACISSLFAAALQRYIARRWSI